MSFSSEVKEELSRQVSRSRHCQLAELAAILGFLGQVEGTGQAMNLTVQTDNITLAKKYFTLIKKNFGMSAAILAGQNTYLNKNRNCTVSVCGETEVTKVLTAVKWMDETKGFIRGDELVNGILVKNACCRRAFVRGAFLAAGSMSDPEKSYHWEIVCPDNSKAEQLREIINSFGLEAKIVPRKKCYVVYLKEGAQIVDILNVMEAHVALMNLENVRILKEMRNSVNRKVNCETANINKTVSAAVKQAEDIQYIENTIGLSALSPGLREIAELRLQYSDMALKELGEMLDPPVGKSGVNHRLRKLGSIAEDLRRNSSARPKKDDKSCLHEFGGQGMHNQERSDDV